MSSTLDTTKKSFAVVLGQCQGDRRKAELELKTLEELDVFPVELAQLAVNNAEPVEMRQLALITLRQYVERHWSADGNPLFASPVAKPDAKEFVRRTLVPQGFLLGEKVLRQSAAQTVAMIAQWDWPEEWPSLFPCLIEILTTSVRDLSDKACIGAVEAVLQVLDEIAAEMSDFDVPKIVPSVIKVILELIKEKERISPESRCYALKILLSFLHTCTVLDEGDKADLYLGRYLHPYISSFLDTLTDDSDSANAEFKCKMIEFVSDLCVEYPSFVSQSVEGGIDGILATTWRILLHYTPIYLARNVYGPLESVDEAAGDEDCPASSILFSLLECMITLLDIAEYRRHIECNLKDLMTQILLLLQLPNSCILKWSRNVSDYVNDTDEQCGFSLRLSTTDAIDRLTSKIQITPLFLLSSVEQLLEQTSAWHSDSNPNWWKLLEVVFYVVWRYAPYLTNACVNRAAMAFEKRFAVPYHGNVKFDMEQLQQNFVEKAMGHTEHPLLQAGALNCASKLVLVTKNSPSAHLETLLELVSGGIVADRPLVVRVTALRVLCDLSDRIHGACEMLLSNCSKYPALTTTYHRLLDTLPELTKQAVQFLDSASKPQLEERIFILALDSINALLRIDPSGFMVQVANEYLLARICHAFSQSHHIPCCNEACLGILKLMHGEAKLSEVVEAALFPVIMKLLGEGEAVEHEHPLNACAGYDLLEVIAGSGAVINQALLHKVFPIVAGTAARATEARVVSGACNLLRRFLLSGLDAVLKWHDEENRGSIRYLLLVVSRLLDIETDLQLTLPGARLASTMLVMIPNEQLKDENVDDILRSVLVRLSSLPANDDDEDGNVVLRICEDADLEPRFKKNPVGAVRRSLLLVFIRQCARKSNVEAIMSYLSQLPDSNGQQTALESFLRMWADRLDDFVSSSEEKICLSAMANIIEWVVTRQARNVLEIQVSVFEEDDETNQASIASRTRSYHVNDKPIQVPLIVKFYKKILNDTWTMDISRHVHNHSFSDEEEEEEPEDGGVEGDPEELMSAGEAQEEDKMVPGEMSETESLSGYEDDMLGSFECDAVFGTKSLDLCASLRDFLCTLSKQDCFREFTRYHSAMNRQMLEALNIVV